MFSHNQTTSATITSHQTLWWCYGIEHPKVLNERNVDNHQWTGILTGGSLFGMYGVDQNGQEKMYYIYTDHLGSPNLITDAECNVVQELSFDAWGNRRDPATWQPYTSLASIPSPLIDRGFTFHEHLYPFILINMNGRAYDPLVGRFLSADPYIQAPDNPQNLNRYSYCLNNPLKYSDPSGNEWWNLWFVDLMDWINDNTEDIRKQMVDAGIPDFNVGFNTSFDGNNREVYGGLDRGLNVSYNNEKGWGLGTSDRFTGDNRFYYPAYNYGAVEQNAMNDYYAGREEAIKDNLASIGEMNSYDFGTIRSWDPTWVDTWSESENFFLKTSYDLVDGVSVTVQSFFRGPNSTHLTGETVYGSDRIDAFVNTVSWAGAISEAASFKVINGGVRWPRWNLRIQGHCHPISPLKGTGAPGTLSPWHLNINGFHIVPSPKYWPYYGGPFFW